MSDDSLQPAYSNINLCGLKVAFTVDFVSGTTVYSMQLDEVKDKRLDSCIHLKTR